MNKYESVIIIKPTLDEKEQNEIINKYENLIKENGELEKTENLGTKKLAYEIQKNKEAIFIIFYFKSEEEFILELERQYRIDDNVLKFIVVKMEE